MLDFEKNFNCPVAGVDEVGRGPLAGPVVAAAVILDKNNLPAGIRDSKKLSNEELESAKNKLKEEQKAVDEVVNSLAEETVNISVIL